MWPVALATIFKCSFDAVTAPIEILTPTNFEITLLLSGIALFNVLEVVLSPLQIALAPIPHVLSHDFTSYASVWWPAPPPETTPTTTPVDTPLPQSFFRRRDTPVPTPAERPEPTPVTSLPTSHSPIWKLIIRPSATETPLAATTVEWAHFFVIGPWWPFCSLPQIP